MKLNNNYNSSKFAILRRDNSPLNGLFSFYIVHLGCISKFLSEGYIPIIDVKTYGNVFNNFKIVNNNPWEIFFEQPFGYTLEEIEKKANIKEYKHCTSNEIRPDEKFIYYNEFSINFWHNFSKKYMSIRTEIIKEANSIMNKCSKDQKIFL